VPGAQFAQRRVRGGGVGAQQLDEVRVRGPGVRSGTAARVAPGTVARPACRVRLTPGTVTVVLVDPSYPPPPRTAVRPAGVLTYRRV